MTTRETKSMVLLRHHLKALRLPTIGAECEKVAAQCAADNADHLNYLLQLAELELLERERRAAERRLKAARFPTMKTLETFDFTACVRTAMREFQPDILLCAGPGSSQRAPVGHCVVQEGWRGIRTKQALFDADVVALA